MKESVLDGGGEGLKKLERKLLPRMTQASCSGSTCFGRHDHNLKSHLMKLIFIYFGDYSIWTF
jgi:hypothetical protein